MDVVVAAGDLAAVVAARLSQGRSVARDLCT